MMAFLVWFLGVVALYSILGYLMGAKPGWFYRMYYGQAESMKESTIMMLCSIPGWPLTLPFLATVIFSTMFFTNLVNFFKKQGAKRIPQ